MPKSTHSVFLLLVYMGVVACISEEINLGPCWRVTLSLSKCCLQLYRKQFGLVLAKRYFKGHRTSKNHKIKLFFID